MSRYGATEVMGHGHAGSLAQLISDSNRPTQYISHAERAAAWWQERSDEADAVRARRCVLDGAPLVDVPGDEPWGRCGACGHLVFLGSRERRERAPCRAEAVKRPNCKGCRKRVSAHLIIGGLCQECRA